jgi:hypothetical protein
VGTVLEPFMRSAHVFVIWVTAPWLSSRLLSVGAAVSCPFKSGLRARQAPPPYLDFIACRPFPYLVHV